MTYDEKVDNIKNNPEQHKHQNMNGLIDCCMLDGAVNTGLMQAHQDYVDMGKNGGIKCDVLEGPCSCGAWHQ